jgi:UDP-N-acetylglucosamine 2-epimerase (non-hydrolysing)
MSTKIATIIGARPQFIKASAVSSVIKRHNISYTVHRTPYKRQALQEVIIHTGQHYDYEMSKIFFEQLKIPEPDYNLGVGSGTQAFQTGTMLIKIEEVLLKEKLDLVLVYGDTNSTLAGALAAAKLNIPVAHIEAGMRSFNPEMPEEINRVLTDHVSTLHFCSTQTAVDNLRKEGINNGVHLVGDVMYDVALKSIATAEKKSKILNSYKLRAKSYYLATVHRQSNTDNTDNLKNILDAFAALDKPVIFPVHPRTRKAINSLYAKRYTLNANIILTEPVSYLDMLMLENNAAKILTDSGGVQKEAYFFKTPCITLRDETEWIETIKAGWNTLTGTDKKKVIVAAKQPVLKGRYDSLYGNGHATDKICRIIIEWFDRLMLRLDRSKSD